MKEQFPEYNIVEYILDLLHFLHTRHIDVDQLSACGNAADLRALPDSQNLLTAYELIKFMDKMPGGFLIYYAGGGEEIIYANKGLLRIFQCETMAEFRAWTANSFRGLVHPDDLEAVEQSIKDQIASSQYDLDYVEYRIVRKDGDVRWIEDYGHFIHSESVGDVFYVFLGDATEKRNRQLLERANLIHEKEQHKQKMQSLIEKYDKERTLSNQEQLRRLEVIEGLSVNYESILYINLDEDTVWPYRLSARTMPIFEGKLQLRKFSWFLSRYSSACVHSEDLELFSRMINPTYIREKLERCKTFYVNYRVFDGKNVQFLQLRVVNVSHHDHVSQIVLGCRRVDEELQNEMEQKQLLTEALNNANLAIVAKNTFLSNMSHDMRTPLNAIFGFTELAKHSPGDPRTLQGYLEGIETYSRQLLDLIDKVLEVAWAGSNEHGGEEVPCNIRDVLQDVYDFLRPQAEEKDIRFSLNCAGLTHPDILCDRDKLKNVILYLVNNAVTYTKPGGAVSITAAETEQLSNNYAVYQFVIQDTGIGISKEFLDRIFEPFVREKNTTAGGIHGIGLGLTIAKNITDMMGGTIRAESTVGKGSTFTVTFRFHMQAQPPRPSPGGPDTAAQPFRQKILLVEDNEINLEIETEILQELGFAVDTAVNGRIAVDKVAGSEPGAYDLILMDIQMPVMDGWQAAAEIRRLQDPALARVPIVALSANVFQSDVHKSIESGIDVHLSKPIDVPLLLKTIQALTNAASHE